MLGVTAAILRVEGQASVKVCDNLVVIATVESRIGTWGMEEAGR